MKTAISIPDPIFQSAERMAHRLRISRSKLYSTAVKRYIEQKKQENITERLNSVYRDEATHLDPVLVDLQNKSLGSEYEE